MKRKTKAQRARRIKEKTAKNAAAREQGQATAEEAQERPRTARQVPMLERYYHRNQINIDQYTAGERFRSDWIGMGKLLSPGRISAQSMELLGASFNDPTPYQIECKRSLDAAIMALGQILSSVLINVCLHDAAASEWARMFGNRPANDGIACLRLALDGLKHHYEQPRRRAVPAPHELAIAELARVMLKEPAKRGIVRDAVPLSS
jgi:Domain of unknown function (DUF6456)